MPHPSKNWTRNKNLSSSKTLGLERLLDSRTHLLRTVTVHIPGVSALDKDAFLNKGSVGVVHGGMLRSRHAVFIAMIVEIGNELLDGEASPVLNDLLDGAVTTRMTNPTI